jgi:hypothetical protein
MKAKVRFTGGPMPLLFITAALALGLLLTQLALNTTLDSIFTPSPEQTAEMLVEALAAGRYAGTRKYFSQDLKSRVSEKDLRDLMRQVEQNRSGIGSAEGIDSVEEGDRATSQLRVVLLDGTEEILRFKLIRENWVWKVESGQGGLVGQ